MIAKRYAFLAKSSQEGAYPEFLSVLDTMNKLSMLIRFYAPSAANEYDKLRGAVEDFYATAIKVEENKRNRRANMGVILDIKTGTDAEVDKTINTIRALSDEILKEVVGIARKMSEPSLQ